jgi:hypothetical protein
MEMLAKSLTGHRCRLLEHGLQTHHVRILMYKFKHEMTLLSMHKGIDWFIFPFPNDHNMGIVLYASLVPDIGKRQPQPSVSMYMHHVFKENVNKMPGEPLNLPRVRELQ